MIEKRFNGRIVHKGDTETNWNKAIGFIPLAKEIIIYLPDENYSYSRIKIGDGKTGINDLPFVVDVNGYIASKDWVEEQAQALGLSLQEYVNNAIQGLATEDYVNELLVGKTDYLGTVATLPDFPEAGAGDFCRVSIEFVYDASTGEVAHVGDILIAVKDNPIQSIVDWDLIHNELSSATLVTVDGTPQVSWEANSKVGFTDYATNDKAGVFKTDNPVWSGLRMASDNVLKIECATETEIESKIQVYKPIVPRYINKAVKVGITTNTETLTDDTTDESGNVVEGDKTKACKWLGALKAFDGSQETGELRYTVYGQNLGEQRNIPYASVPKEGALAQYRSGNSLQTGLVRQDNDCTNKKYVDDNFVPKLEIEEGALAGNLSQAYIITPQNEVRLLTITEWGASPNTLAKRDHAGRLAVATPNANNDATNKKYVDDNFVAKGEVPATQSVYTQTPKGEIQTIALAGAANGAIFGAIPRYMNPLYDGADTAPNNMGNLVCAEPTKLYHAANKKYVDDNFVAKTQVDLSQTGNTIPIRDASGHLIVKDPTEKYHTATKGYVDNLPDKLVLTDDTTAEDGTVTEGTKTKWQNWLNVVPKPTASGLVYYNKTTGESNVQSTYTSVPGGNQIPKANSKGCIKTNTPEEDLDCANKAYVDDGFVPKIEYSDTQGQSGSDGNYLGRAYAVRYDGTQTSYPIGNQNKTYSIAIRDAYGNFYVGDPSNGLHCANKRYVDDGFVANVEYSHTNTMPTGSPAGVFARAYVVDHEGNNNSIPLSSQVMSGMPSIPIRTASGNFYVSDPTLDYQCTNKKYVDKLIPKYRIIRDITLEEDIAEISIDTDDNGNAFKLKGVLAMFNGKFTTTASNVVLHLIFNGGAIYQMWSSNLSVTTETEYGHWVQSDRVAKAADGNYLYKSTYPKSLLGNFINGKAQGLSANNVELKCDTSFGDTAYHNPITKINYGNVYADRAEFAAGSRIIIWGIDDNE